MSLEGKVVAVTGGANGIGTALVREASARGARGIAVIDLEFENAERVAAEIGGKAYACNVGSDEAVAGTIAAIEADFGEIDVYCSNAGIGYADGPTGTAAGCELDEWNTIWQVNVMSHVHAARALLPKWIERGSGQFLITASAAGLLSQIGSASYSTTKHAAVGYAESLAITHGDDGIQVSMLCPQGVRTRMIAGSEDSGAANQDGIMEPEDVAKFTLDAMAEGVFCVTPHKIVREYMSNKTDNYERWVGGMRKYRRHLATLGDGRPM